MDSEAKPGGPRRRKMGRAEPEFGALWGFCDQDWCDGYLEPRTECVSGDVTTLSASGSCSSCFVSSCLVLSRFLQRNAVLVGRFKNEIDRQTRGNHVVEASGPAQQIACSYRPTSRRIDDACVWASPAIIVPELHASLR